MVYHHISLVEEHLLHFDMDKKYTRWIWHGEGDPNEVVYDDDDIDAAEPIEHGGIGSLLDDLHHHSTSNVSISTYASQGSSDHEYNIDEVAGTFEQLAKLF